METNSYDKGPTISYDDEKTDRRQNPIYITI